MSNRNADQKSARNTKALLLRSSLLITAGVSILALPQAAIAQDSFEEDEVIAVGIRQSLENALVEKRQAVGLKEVILAEDIGKLPDQNLAEVLENVTGVQITRTAGVGTGVQIRGTDANRTEINGVTAVGSGGGRGGISFEDVSAGIIAGVEVIKAPEAKTIEGSVGGTINLRTIRPLDLNEPLLTARIQGEKSSLSSEDNWTPRISGTVGNKWENAKGQEIGVVLAVSYAEQESTSFRPRVDRDGSLVENNTQTVVRGTNVEDPSERPAAQSFDFLGIQFLNQELENFEYETTNVAFSVEAAPTNNVKLYFDAIANDQERRSDSTRVQASGVTGGGDSLLVRNLPDTFETVDFGSLDGVAIGSIQAALTGRIQPDLGADDDDPNLRFNSDTNARVTESRIYRVGTEWEKGNFSGVAEYSNSTSDSTTPSLNAQLNFINPNPLTPLDNLDDDGNPTASTSNDNVVPYIYDLSGDSLTFGIDFDSPFAPTVDQLLDPNNVVLDQVDVSRNSRENSEQAFRLDFNYDFSETNDYLTSVDFGYRYNETESTFDRRSDRVGGFSRLSQSPNGSTFADLLVRGPSNFGDADGRELALRNFIIVDPDRAFSDPNGVLATLEAAVLAHDPSYNPIDLSRQASSSFNIVEESSAFYAQGNFEAGIFRGNVGLRYVETDIESNGNSVLNGVVTPNTTTSSYDFVLPRFNVVADVTEDIVIRGGWGQDIRRPDFDDLNTSTTFNQNENQSVDIGNPNLRPELVDSFDIGAEWYFAPSSVLSIGYFKKDREDIIADQTSFASTINNTRETDPNCPGGGVFNPIAETNSFGPADTTGICVDADTKLNDAETTTQQGIEMGIQYDLSGWEDRMGGFGWASGFGVQANYTIQEFSGGGLDYTSATRGTDIFNALNGIYNSNDFVRVTLNQGLLNFSEDAYNITGYYEKYGISARLRYTWRDAYRTTDTAAGASLNSTLGFPVVTSARGQLNGSINYDVTENFNIGLEAVNIGEEKILQYCVNDGALLCAEGITDRRVIVGGSYRF